MNPSRKLTAMVVSSVLFVSAMAVLFMAARPSPALSLDRHWNVFGKHAALAALLLIGASSLAQRRYRVAVTLVAVLMLSLAALAHPVCVLIPEAERPTFETVIPLQERAARGEPFCKLEGQWYQCKSFIARAFFF